MLLDFNQEVVDMINDAAKNHYLPSEIVNEITGLKLSMNKTVRECIKACSIGIFTLLAKNITVAERGQIAKVIEQTLDQWRPVFKKFVDSNEDEVYLIQCIEVSPYVN